MPVYLDHNATTPLDSRVLEAMLPYLREHHGNPSSAHRFGRTARAALEAAREQVAALVNAHPSQVVFTSGGTESNNLAIRGIAARLAVKRIVVGATEHASVTEAADALAADGWRVDRLPVNRLGLVSADALDEMLRPAPALVSVMYANNETGVIQDIPWIAEAVRAAGAHVHTDAVQAAGKIAVDFPASGAHAMSLSAHKINGPKGVGALIVDKTVDMVPLLYGGGQEKGRRSGTEHVAGIVGFGAAAALAAKRITGDGEYLLRLRERLEAGLGNLDGVAVFARAAPRLPNTVYFSAPGVDGETLVLQLDKAGFAVASGSACGTGKSEPSPVLAAMGIEPELARGAIRVSLGTENTEAEIDAFVAALGTRLRQLHGPARRAAG